MEHDITLKWRPGHNFSSQTPCRGYKNKIIVIEDCDDFLPEDESLPKVYKGPQGPVLDGVHLETLGVEDVDGSSAQRLTVLAAVALTAADPSEADTQQPKPVIAPELSVVVTLDCGGGGSILASEGLLTVREAVGQDWKALECNRAHGPDNIAKLLRVTTGSQECLTMLRKVTPHVVVGDACRRFGGIQEMEGISGAISLAQAAIASDAEFSYSNDWQPSANDGMKRRDSPRYETRVIHRVQSGGTSEPSRDS